MFNTANQFTHCVIRFVNQSFDQFVTLISVSTLLTCLNKSIYLNLWNQNESVVRIIWCCGNVLQIMENILKVLFKMSFPSPDLYSFEGSSCDSRLYSNALADCVRFPSWEDALNWAPSKTLALRKSLPLGAIAGGLTSSLSAGCKHTEVNYTAPGEIIMLMCSCVFALIH